MNPRNQPTSSGEIPVVECQEVTKVFKDFWMRDKARAVERLSLKIMPREVFGLLGPNGSGKSTTIKMILGLLRPTAGRIAVLGKAPSDVEVKRRIGYLPEESYLYPFLNARETLDYYGRLFGIEHRVRVKRIDELLDMIGLVKAQFRQVREYSKGMQRRIGIAQALINDPDFLILDEPTTGLDPVGTRQVKDLIIELGRRGKTVLLSSHLLADVEDCVDRMVILYGGSKRAEGTCSSLLEHEHRTTIETDTLDEATIAEIDRIVRERSGGSSAVRRVARPRQSLESLFLNIVERAKAEQATTSGAVSGGATAAFLRESGRDVIDRLMVQVGGETERAAAPAPVSAGPDRDVIADLVSAAPQAPATARAPGAAPAAPIDASVIDSLLAAPKNADPGKNA